MTENTEVDASGMVEEKIDRIETGYRIGLTILFWIISRIAAGVIGLIVVYELAMTLITLRPPSPRIREFANRIVSYRYKIGRYLVYCETQAPFPFSDFPAAMEPDAWQPGVRESANLGLD